MSIVSGSDSMGVVAAADALHAATSVTTPEGAGRMDHNDVSLSYPNCREKGLSKAVPVRRRGKIRFCSFERDGRVWGGHTSLR